MSNSKYLADINVLIALTDENHIHHEKVSNWYRATGRPGLGLCTLTESGFLRIATNPKAGKHSIEDAIRVLKNLQSHPGYRYWPMTEGWVALVEPFAARVFGHQQITDAYLLGLAVKEGGVLVTMDRAIEYLAGVDYARHVLLLE